MAKSSNETATGFADEVFFGLRRQRNVLGFIAAGSITVALTSVVALCIALPMKEIRPYVVMVDRSTGESEQIVTTRPGSLSEQEAVREAEIVRYVTDRETYDVADNAARIPMVANTSVGQASTSLRALWNSSAENYPPNIYGTDTLITVKVASISMLGDTTAQVRFTRRLERPGDNPIERNFVATVGFEFRPRVERNLEQVWRNPLGFTVTNYRVDAETLRAREN
ncbi:virB8 family protein [Acuticoccus sediminis]|uniref:virB8 family protein n=1 Tax=Acuticoccus sediminis TaxID=2184697 RepID=UPI001CFCC13F|nr:type IV secretion system protein [Acuticoccus sediminis]